MKKLFTTILMMGVALGSWAVSSLTGGLSNDGKTLTVTYVADPNDPIKFGPKEIEDLAGGKDALEGVETLVFAGDFANKDLPFIGEIVEKCAPGQDNTKTVYLDLSGCTKMKSTVNYTKTGTPDWASDDFEFLPNSTVAVTLPVTKTQIVHEATRVENPVELIVVRGTEVEVYKYKVEKKQKFDWILHQPNNDATVTGDLPEAFLNEQNINQRYNFTLWGNPATIYYNFDEESWYVTQFEQNYPLTLVQRDGYTYSYIDENGNKHTQDYVWGLTPEGDDYYYIRYKDNGEWKDSCPDVVQSGGKLYRKDDNLVLKYNVKWEDGQWHEQDKSNEPKQLTANNDGSYSYIYYSFLDKDNKPKTETNPNGLSYNEDDGKWYIDLGYKYTAQYEDEYIEVEQHAVIDDGNGNLTTNYYPVSFSLADDFFKKAGKLNGISFPENDNFTAIPNQVFGEEAPASLTSATVGDNLIWIGEDAFRKSGLASFDIPAGIKVIGPEAFDFTNLSGCIDLEDCTSLAKIGFEAFEGCPGITSVKFPAGDVLTFLGNDAFKETGLTAVDMSMCEGITEFQSKENMGTQYKTFQKCYALETVILPPNLTAIPDDGGDGVFSGCTALKTVTFTGTPVYDGCTLTNPITIGTMAFFQDTDGDGRTNLTTVKLSKNVSLIKSNAFQGAKFTELHIPASVGEIEINAFYNCQDLTKLYFDEFDTTYGNCDGAETIIRGGASDAGGQGQGAFEECQHITDIYFNSSAPLHCENNAFDQDITWGAGNADGNFATLHYPKDLIENYVNIKHYLTDADAQDRGKFHLWLHDHYRQAYSEPYKNGWYEFINSGFIELDVIEYSDIILRTFSDLNYAYIVPNGLRAYIVTNVDPVNSEDYQVTLKRIDVIPAKTGVILYGQPNGTNADGNPTLTMTAVQFTEGQGQPYNHTSKIKNYLEPILSTDGSPVTIYPYEPYRTGDPVEVRNFALGRYDNTDYFKLNKNVPTDFDLTSGNYVGFFRMKPEAYKSGYAYLKLYADEFSIADGGEIFVQPDNVYDPANGKIPYNYEIPMTSEGKISDAKDMSAEFDDVVIDEVPHVIPKPATNPKGWWNTKPIPPTPGHAPVPTPHVWNEPSLSWGDRNVAFKKLPAAKFLGEFEEDTDGIVKLIVPGNATANGEFYTLQGVKVTNPTKGVYIQNGKKVIIK